MHPAALQAGAAAAAYRDARLPGRDDLALLEHPAAAVEYGDADTGRIVDRAAAHGRTCAAAYLDAGRGPGDDPHVQQLRGALLDEQRGRGRVLALHVQVLDDGGGTDGQRHAVHGRDAHGAGRALGAAQCHRALDDEVLPVRTGGDGEYVAVGGRFQGRGQ